MTELEGYRRQIDAIDAQLVELFLRRMEVTGAVGRYKQERGLPVLDAEQTWGFFIAAEMSLKPLPELIPLSSIKQEPSPMENLKQQQLHQQRELRSWNCWDTVRQQNPARSIRSLQQFWIVHSRTALL